MKKRLFVFGLSLLVVVWLAGCGDKVDQDELREAENLVNGINMMAMMTNVDAYSGLNASGSLDAPPHWEGPDTFSVPDEWVSELFYKWLLIKFPIDSMGTTIDSASLYLMFTPDIWDSLYQDSTPTAMEIGILADTRDIWFHTIVEIPDTESVNGSMKWNWEETWYKYEYDVSQITEAGKIDITTSSDIGLAAHFLFDDDGAGTTEDNYAEWNNTIFVKYEFFAEPDPEGYDGYYILLSEAWKVKHYFVLAKEPPTF